MRGDNKLMFEALALHLGMHYVKTIKELDSNASAFLALRILSIPNRIVVPAALGTIMGGGVSGPVMCTWCSISMINDVCTHY